MGKTDKILQAMKQNPKDWRIQQLYTVAKHMNIIVRSTGGSHHIFSHEGVDKIVCVPAHRPIKPVYIRQCVTLCQHILELTNE